MKWHVVQVDKVCFHTPLRDPRREPDKPFKFVDHSSIDRKLKVILKSTPEFLGSEAPSRARKEIREGDVLVSTISPNLNAIAMVPPELDGQIASTRFCVLRPNQSIINSKFLFYFSTTQNFKGMLTSKVRGSHHPVISDDDVRQLHLPLPTLSEQIRIVEILDQADALRRKRAEADEKAARIKPSLFYRMFGDSVENPKSHVKKSLCELVKIETGKFLSDEDIDPTGRYPVYGGKGIIGWHSDSMFDDSVIVIGREGADCGAIHYSRPHCWVTNDAFYVAEHSKELHTRYLVEALREIKLNQYGGRVGQTLLDWNRISQVEVLVPPLEQQENFVKRMVNFQIHEQRRQDSGENIERLFSVLRHLAFTSKLTASWRAVHTKEILLELEEQMKALKRLSAL